MTMLLQSRTRFAFLAAAALALALIGLAVFMEWREANDTAIVPVALNPDDPSQIRIGALIYRGGLDIPRMGQNIGGLSALRWDPQTGRLLALTDDARFVWMTPEEEGERLVGVRDIEVGPLLGEDGEPLQGKEQGDSEALVRARKQPLPDDPEDHEDYEWAVAFERDHRILLYTRGLEQPPYKTDFEPEEELGELEDNGGLEAFAVSDTHHLLCAERAATAAQSNCVLWRADGEGYSPFPVAPPADIAQRGGVPTDADALSDGRFLVLFRSYSSSEGNSAAIVAYSVDGTREAWLTLRPPLSVDNFEGLAVREEAGRTFLYIVSDDNFSSNQSTLLMKFEIAPGAS